MLEQRARGDAPPDRPIGPDAFAALPPIRTTKIVAPGARWFRPDPETLKDWCPPASTSCGSFFHGSLADHRQRVDPAPGTWVRGAWVGVMADLQGRDPHRQSSPAQGAAQEGARIHPRPELQDLGDQPRGPRLSGTGGRRGRRATCCCSTTAASSWTSTRVEHHRSSPCATAANCQQQGHQPRGGGLSAPALTAGTWRTSAPAAALNAWITSPCRFQVGAPTCWHANCCGRVPSPLLVVAKIERVEAIAEPRGHPRPPTASWWRGRPGRGGRRRRGAGLQKDHRAAREHNRSPSRRRR